MIKVINLKMQVGNVVIDAKRDKTSEGCMLNGVPVPILEALVKHAQEVLDFQKSQLVKKKSKK